jgi:hypothetical protein
MLAFVSIAPQRAGPPLQDVNKCKQARFGAGRAQPHARIDAAR